MNSFLHACCSTGQTRARRWSLRAHKCHPTSPYWLLLALPIVGDGEYVEWENGSGKSAEFELTPPDNVRLWRLAGNAIGRFMMLQRRASERVYAPGGMGMESVRREFEALAVASQVE